MCDVIDNRPMRSALLGLLAVSGFGLALGLQTRAEPDRAAQVRVEPCEWQDMRLECGTLTVPEDHDAPHGRTISLFFVIARATGEAVDDPVFYFAGGPGSASSRSARGHVEKHAMLRRTRDFVFLDQRGTGRSHPLRCETPPGPARLLAPIFDRAEAAACRAALAPVADLRKYTTADAARDLDAVRQALGYERLNLIGTSYGSRMAWTYAAMFPAHARTLVLIGPVHPGFRVPLPFSPGLDAALEGVLAACETDAACHDAYPSLRRDTERAFDRLRAGPVPVTAVERAEDGDPVTEETAITYGEFAESVRYALYTAGRARALPMLLTRAGAGDYGPTIEAAVANRRNLDGGIYTGMYLSVTCAEDLPFITDEEARAVTSGTRLGTYRVDQQRDACAEWPRGERLPSSTTKPVETPALLEVGAYDPATPLAEAGRALPLLPNGRLLEVPHGGHGLGGVGVDACLTGIERQFIEQGTSRDIDTSCIATARREPFIIPR